MVAGLIFVLGAGLWVFGAVLDQQCLLVVVICLVLVQGFLAWVSAPIVGLVVVAGLDFLFVFAAVSGAVLDQQRLVEFVIGWVLV